MAKTKRVRIYGPEMGYCNICETYGKLTDDHIPPKGSAKIRPLESRTLSQHYSKEKTKFRLSQNGFAIRSLCSECNNKRLGKEFDPHLNKISYEVRRHLSDRNGSLIILPNKISFEIKPQRVARAVVGHLLAGSLSDEPDNKPIKAPMPDGFRAYFLDPSLPMPKELNIYYWLYPSNVQNILKNIGIGVVNSSSLIGDILKYFPIAYWAVWSITDKTDLPYPLQRLLKKKDIGIDESDEISIDFVNVQRFDWPENPDDNHIVLYREETTVVSSPYRRKRMLN